MLRKTATGKPLLEWVIFFSPALQTTANFSAAISGKVTDEQNQPLAGTEVRSNGQVLGVTNDLGQFNFSVTTAGQQEWTVEKVGYLTATLNVSLTQTQSFSVGTVRLPTATSNQTQIATGQLVIQGIDTTINQPIDGISVKAELLGANNTILQTQTFSATGSQGEPLREAKISLPVGSWKLTISHPAYDSKTTTLTVDANQQKTASVNLVSKNYSATGVLIDSQTNQPIKNSPVEAFNNKTNVRVWSGVTDGNGRFSTPTTMNGAELRLEFSPALYLSGNRYIYREIQSESVVDLAQIRLRPRSAEIVQPDLSISKIYTDGLQTHQQTLRVQGQLRLDLVNKGLADTNAPFDIFAFADL